MRILLLVLLLACSSKPRYSITQLNDAPGPSDTIEILTEKPSREYIALGYIRITKASGEQVRQILRQEGMRMGGDAVLFETHQEMGADYVPYFNVTMPYTTISITGTVIRYR